MITLSKIRSTAIEAGRRIIKVLQFGTKTAIEAAPFGDDSNPINNLSAVYADTSETGEPVIIGYINENQLAAIGEKRIYSLDTSGNISFSIHLKNNGTCEIGGQTHNLLRFTPLDTALQAQVAKINSELAKIATAITTLGGIYIPTPITINITPAKINEIKTL